MIWKADGSEGIIRTFIESHLKYGDELELYSVMKFVELLLATAWG